MYYTDHLFYKKEIETTCTVFKVSFIIDLCTVTETRCSSHHFPMDGDDVASEWAIDRWHLVAIGHAIGRAGLCATGYHGAGHPLWHQIQLEVGAVPHHDGVSIWQNWHLCRQNREK